MQQYGAYLVVSCECDAPCEQYQCTAVPGACTQTVVVKVIAVSAFVQDNECRTVPRIAFRVLFCTIPDINTHTVYIPAAWAVLRVADAVVFVIRNVYYGGP